MSVPADEALPEVAAQGGAPPVLAAPEADGDDVKDCYYYALKCVDSCRSKMLSRSGSRRPPWIAQRLCMVCIMVWRREM